MRNPVTGRLYLASKNVFGGILYAVPRHLSATDTNRLTRIGRITQIATDGAFFPDGRHLVVRNYTSATVYDWPSLQRVGTFDLPFQKQGEGIAVGPDDTLYLSSEGIGARVLATRVPAEIRQAMEAPPAPTATPTPESSAGQQTGDPSEPSDSASHDAWPWVVGGLFAVVAGLVLVRALRPH